MRTKTMISSALLSILLLLPAQSFARKEISFCPAGGPPGWMNYFDRKRDEKRYRRMYRQLNAYYGLPYRPINHLYYPPPWMTSVPPRQIPPR